MRYPAKYTKTDHTPGTSRLKRVFAWLPVYMDNGIKVWLEHYEVLQVYVIVVHSVVLDPDKPKDITQFKLGSWVDISKRLMK